MALFLTFVLGLFFVAGAAIIRFSSKSETFEHFSVAAAFGALAGLAAFDLIPEIIEESHGTGTILNIVFAVAGLLLLLLLDKFVPDHDSDDEEEHMLHIGVMAVIALFIHNIVEGMTVFNVANASVMSGLTMTIGVGLHNIPMGMFIYTAVMHEKRSRKYPILAAAALSSFIGGLAMFLINGVIPEEVVIYLVCIALGMVIYLLVFELFPALKGKKNIKLTVIGVAVGVLFVLGSAFLEVH